MLKSQTLLIGKIFYPLIYDSLIYITDFVFLNKVGQRALGLEKEFEGRLKTIITEEDVMITGH